MISRGLKYKVSNDYLGWLAIWIFLSKIQYGITVYGATKLKLEDKMTEATESLQVIANTMMRLIKPRKNTTS